MAEVKSILFVYLASGSGMWYKSRVDVYIDALHKQRFILFYDGAVVVNTFLHWLYDSSSNGKETAINRKHFRLITVFMQL